MDVWLFHVESVQNEADYRSRPTTRLVRFTDVLWGGLTEFVGRRAKGDPLERERIRSFFEKTMPVK
jgi:hypothetical protein